MYVKVKCLKTITKDQRGKIQVYYWKVNRITMFEDCDKLEMDVINPGVTMKKLKQRGTANKQ